MFFHTHVYYAKKVNPKLDNLIIIGSLLPDFAITSAISWDDLHKRKGILDFSSLISTTYPDEKNLLTGLQYHNVLDYFSHIKYQEGIGYAYANTNAELINLVSKAFSIDKKLARITAHNFIESAVEMYVLKQNPELQSLVKNAISETGVEQLANIISVHNHKPSEKTINNLNEFFSLITKYDLNDLEEWIALWRELGMHLFKKDVNKETVRLALKLSLELTNDTYKEFLNTAISTKQEDIVDSN